VVISINGHEWEPLPGVQYRFKYDVIARNIAKGKFREVDAYRTLFREDSWAFLYFVMGYEKANHPWIIETCREVDLDSDVNSLDLWAREHFKTTVLTVIKNIQRILVNPELCVGLFSHTKPIALGFLRSIKGILESSDFLKYLYPDILYQNPEREAFSWSLDMGLYVKRKSIGRKEATFEAHGLIEGMPTSKHFDVRVYDDVETLDSVQSPEMIKKVCDAFDMSHNLGTDLGTHHVIGTTYHHEGLLQKLRERKRETGELVYKVRVKPATVDGTPNGDPVLLSPARIADLRVNKQMFFSQQLLNPTPTGEQKLDPNHLQFISPAALPKRLYKFMVIDPAGVRKDRTGDSWAIWVIGVEPLMDDLGASKVFLLDACIEPMNHDEAMKSCVDLYVRNGKVRTIGIEKVGMSSAEIHLASALRARGKYLTLENGGITLLRPAGRSKGDRIEGNLMWPLNNSKIFVCSTVPNACVERLKLEMGRYPFWHDDALDAFSYVYDLIKDFRFGKVRHREKEADPWASSYVSDGGRNSWMIC